MPLTLEKLRIGRATIPVKYGDEVVSVTYRAGAITPAWQAALRLTSHDNVARNICLVVEAWDITENGEPFDIEPDRVMSVPLPLLRKILSEILFDVSPGKASAVTSDAG